jgi:hypothetical protein
MPQEFLERRHIAADAQYWLDEQEGDLVLHPRLRDVHKPYLEPTTTCNLHCRTCIRNAWEHAEAHMSTVRFGRVPDSLSDLRETCDLRARNKDCWGTSPSCANCLWAQDTVRCP